MIEELKKEEKNQEYASIRHKLRYKIIYLQEQRKLLDLNLKACDNILAILAKCKENSGKL